MFHTNAYIYKINDLLSITNHHYYKQWVTN